MNTESFLKLFIEWVTHQQAVEALALVGSHARGTASETSDVDLMILTSERAQYLLNPVWVPLFGDVERVQKETWGAVETIRATYTNGLEVEYNFASSAWADVPVDPGTRR